MNLKGYTFAELIIVMAIFMTVIGLATINLTSAKQQATLNTSIDILVSDMRGQQIKAMMGDTQNEVTASAQGIHFAATRYVLFHGNMYNSSDPKNFSVAFGDNISVVGNPSDIIFQRVSGEVTSASSVTLRDNTTHTEKILQYNKYGSVYAVE